MKAFISYSREDSQQIIHLVSDLNQLGHEVWIDTSRLHGGQEWWDEILHQIARCDVFVLAISPNVLESEPCQLELGYAAATARPFLPVLVTQTSSNILPPEIAHAQLVDYKNPDKSSLIALVAAIDQIPAGDPPYPLPPPPPRPESPLYAVRQLVQTPQLDRKQQLGLLDDLEQLSTKPKFRDEVITLLRQFRQRPDIIADIRDKVDDVLAKTRQASKETKEKKSKETPQKSARADSSQDVGHRKLSPTTSRKGRISASLTVLGGLLLIISTPVEWARTLGSEVDLSAFRVNHRSADSLIAIAVIALVIGIIGLIRGSLPVLLRPAPLVLGIVATIMTFILVHERPAVAALGFGIGVAIAGELVLMLASVVSFESSKSH